MKKIKSLVLMVLLILPILVNAESVKDGDTVYVFEERKIECLTENMYPYYAIEDGSLVVSDGEEFMKINHKNECLKLTEEEIKEITNLGYGWMGYYIDKDENGKYLVYIPEKNYDISGRAQTTDTEVNIANSYYETLNENGEFVYVDNPVNEDLGKYYEYAYFKTANGTEFNETLTYYVKMEGELNYFNIVVEPKAEELDKYYYIVDEPMKEISYDVLSQEAMNKLVEEYEYADQAIQIGENEFLIKAQRYMVDSVALYDVYTSDGKMVEALSGVRRVNKIANGLIMVMKDDSIEFYNNSLVKLFAFASDNVDETNPGNKHSLNDYGYENYVQHIVKEDITTGTLTYYSITDYKVIEGENQTYSDGDLKIRFSGELDKLVKVLVNDVELDKNNYTLESGSTIVTLKKEYLDTLAGGTYTLKVEYSDGGSSEAKFTLEEKKAEQLANETTQPPNTIDNIGLYIIIFIVSIGGLVLVKKYFKNEKRALN